MAGKKKGRKRPAKRSLKSSEKRDPIQNVQEISACVEEKKPKLNDESEKRDEQLSVDKQEPKLETVDSKNNDSVGDLQEEESKYVPPFSRKRVLKRSGAPPSPAARPKRSWRGAKQNLNSKQAQPAECRADIDDKQSDVCMKDSPDSPKIEKEERKEVEEEEVDVVGIQEDEDSFAFSASETTAGNVTEAKDGVVLTLPPSVQKDTSTVVSQVLVNVVDAVCKMVQCNSDETIAESEKDNAKSTDVREIHAEQLNNRSHSLGSDISKCDNKAIVATKELLDTNMDAAIETTSSTTTAGTEEMDSLMKNFAFDGSTLAKTKSVDNSTTSDQETLDTAARSEGHLRECVAGDVESTHVTLQRCNKAEKLYSSEEVDKESVKNSFGVNVACDMNYVHEREDKPQNSETENLSITSPSVKSAVLPGNIRTALKEEIHSTSTITVASVDTELKSPGISTDHKLQEKNYKETGSNSLLKTVELTSHETEIRNEKNGIIEVTLMSQQFLGGSDICDKTVNDTLNRHSGLDEENHLTSPSNGLLKTADMTAERIEMCSKENVGKLLISELPGPNIGESDNAPMDSCHLTQHQHVDQMVPANYEPTTVLSQGTPDGTELARKPDQNELEEWPTKGANMSLKTAHLFQDKKENQANKVEVTQTQPSAPKTALSIRELERSHQEEPQSLGTAHTSELCTDQESSNVKSQIKMDQTCMESSAQGSSTSCKQIMLGVTEPQSNEPVAGENNSVLQSSELAQGCSSFSTDGDILEFDCLMDCTDSQLVGLDSSTDQPPHQNLDTRQVNDNKVTEPTTNEADQHSVEVPPDNGMIKGLISELSTLNKFIMGAWKDLENQKKQRQARLKSAKGKKLK